MLIQNSPAPKGSPMSSPVPGGSSGSSGGPSSKQAASGSGDITEKKITEKKGGDITSRLAFRVTIFLTLALQNASLVMLTRWTKMYRPEAHNPDNDANVVVWGEIVKLWISIGVVLYNVFLRNPFDSPEKITSEISDSDDAIHVAYSGGLLSTANIMKATGLKTEVPDGARRSTPGSLRLSSLSSKNWDCDDWEEQIIEWCLPPDVSKKDSDRDSASKEASQGKVLKPESQGKAETRQRRRPSQIAREESDQNPALAIELSATQKCVAGILNRVMKSPKQIKERYALLVRKQMGNGIEFMLMTIPGCIYLVQNRLIFFAYSKLPGPVFQVTYQLKILTGAFVARFVLKQILSWRKWFALALLVVGVVTVQVDGIISAFYYLHLQHWLAIVHGRRLLFTIPCKGYDFHLNRSRLPGVSFRRKCYNGFRVGHFRECNCVSLLGLRWGLF